MHEKRAKKWNEFPLKGKVPGEKKKEKKQNKTRSPLRAESDFKGNACAGAETNY